jgi:hypothetical protein
MNQFELAEIARAIFSEIEAAHPSVSFDRTEETLESERWPAMDVKKQPGVTLSIGLYVLGDELYLDCGGFHASCFPSNERPVQERYFGYVSGLLKGTHRVVDFSRGSRIVRADLQTWNGVAWVPVSGWSRLTWPWPRLKQSAIHINSAAPTERNT